VSAALPPPLLVLTDRSQCTGPLPRTVAIAVAAGARAVVLREKDLPASQRCRLAEELAAVLAPVGGLLILAGAPPAWLERTEWAQRMPRARLGGVHLSAADELPSPRPPLVGRSCHNDAEVAAASAQACDYVTVSPVFATASKPGYGPALGLDNLGALCRTAGSSRPRTVYAQGGVSVADAANCVGAGARGVAVMGPIMRDPNIVAAYLAALPEVLA
jgi:thiamine monophosphate synthase